MGTLAKLSRPESTTNLPFDVPFGNEESVMKDAMETISKLQNLNPETSQDLTKRENDRSVTAREVTLAMRSRDLQSCHDSDNTCIEDDSEPDIHADLRKYAKRGFFPKLDPPFEDHEIEPIGTNKPCAYCEYQKRRTKNGWYVYSRFRCNMCGVALCKGYGEHTEAAPQSVQLNPEENRSPETAVDIFKGWLQKQNQTVDLEFCSSEILNDCLTQFYVQTSMDVRMNRNNLRDLRDNLLEYIAMRKGWTLELTLSELLPSNIIFENCQVCQGIRDDETYKYKGSRKIPISRDDMKLLMSSDLFSCQSPIGLVRKVWYDLTVHLGIGGQDALRSLQDNSFLLETDEFGNRYCRLSENTRGKGARCLSEMQSWDWNARMYEIPGDPNCPFASFNLYMSKRNPGNTAFFQRPKTISHSDMSPWFDTPLGHCILARIMSKMSTEAKLSKVYTNSMVRLTAANFLEERGIAVMNVMNIHPRYKPSNQNLSGQKTSEELLNASNMLHDLMYNV